MNKIKTPIFDKNSVREEVRNRLHRKTREEKSQESKRICEQLICLQAVQNASHIYAYRSFDDEVCLNTFIEWALAQKKQVFAPSPAKQKWGFGGQTVGAGGIQTSGGMEKIASFCPPNSFGTFSAKSTKSASEIHCSPLPETGIILVPGRAFTLSGKRIGRGGGWYDIFLAKNPHLLTIGVCFGCQIFPDLPQDVWDILMHQVMTYPTRKS